MIRISGEQFRALEMDAQGRWRQRLLAWLRLQAPLREEMDDAALGALIIRQEQCAAQYGVFTERGLAKWCWMAVATAEQFDKAADVDEFMRDPRYGPPPTRIDRLMRAYERLEAISVREAARV